MSDESMYDKMLERDALVSLGEENVSLHQRTAALSETVRELGERLENERSIRWWATYNAVINRLAGMERPSTMLLTHHQCVAYANLAHGELKP